MSREVCIIIPAFNEELSIGELIRNLRNACGVEWEIIVVDDGSTDATAKRAKEAGARVIEHHINRGYGASLATGIRLSEADVIVTLDGDGQHDPCDVPRLIRVMHEHDMVVGWRSRGSHIQMQRRPGKKVLSVFANYLAKEKIPDVNSGFRAFRRTVIRQYLHLMPSGFSFSTTSTFAMLKGGRRIGWLPIETGPRKGVSTVKQLRDGPSTLMLMLRLTVLFDPLRVFLPVSAGLGFGALVMALINFVFFRPAIPATSVFLGVSSILVFMLGLVTDQVSAIRREFHEEK